MAAIAEMAVRADRDLVLAVDDNEHNLQLLEEYLQTWGYDVVFARDGAEALELYPRVDPSIIVLDVMMPVMDGYSFLQELEKLKPVHRPLVIVLTAGGTPRQLNAEIVAGTVRKPFDIPLLVDTVAALLASREDVAQLDSCPLAESETTAPRPRNGAG